MSGILLFAESADALFELLTAAAGLRGDGRVTALAVGTEAKAITEECLARGADAALFVPAASLDPEQLVACLKEAVRAVEPETVLISATRTGSDVAARLGQALQAPCASDCLSLTRDTSGDIVVERRLYGGRFVARQILSGAPIIATVPPKRFPAAEQTGSVATQPVELAVSLPQPRIRRRSTSARTRSEVDITKADVIVGAGRGVKKREDLALLEGLAGTLGGVLAGTRPLTGDVDWIPADRRIGLSGQTVKPKLYIACGISGQVEHIVGMKGARTVIAINNDPKAPIHDEADYSIVGDLYEIVPAIVGAVGER